MMNNKKALAGLAVIFAIMLFFAGMVIYQFIKPDISTMRGATQMNCDSPDTHGDKAVCLVVDTVIPIFIIGVFSAAGGMITNEALRK